MSILPKTYVGFYMAASERMSNHRMYLTVTVRSDRSVTLTGESRDRYGKTTRLAITLLPKQAEEWLEFLEYPALYPQGLKAQAYTKQPFEKIEGNAGWSDLEWSVDGDKKNTLTLLTKNNYWSDPNIRLVFPREEVLKTAHKLRTLLELPSWALKPERQ